MAKPHRGCRKPPTPPHKISAIKLGYITREVTGYELKFVWQDTRSRWTTSKDYTHERRPAGSDVSEWRNLAVALGDDGLLVTEARELGIMPIA